MRHKLTLLDYIRQSDCGEKEEGAILHLLRNSYKASSELSYPNEESSEIDLVVGDFQDDRV